MDVGQGLAVLLEADGHYALYDGGPRSTSSRVVAYLKKQGIEKLDYVIASHYDEDHISGIVGAIHAFDVGTVIAPDYVGGTKIYQSFITALVSKGLQVTYPVVGEEYDLGGASFTILGPILEDPDDDNDQSVVVRVEVEGCSLLLTGDASKVSEKAMMEAGLLCETDLLVAGHHGSANSTSKAFLDTIAPKGVIISCGSDNAYGHPSEVVMHRLGDIPVYRTDKQGDLRFYVQNGQWHGQEAYVDASVEEGEKALEPIQVEEEIARISVGGELQTIKEEKEVPRIKEEEEELSRIEIPRPIDAQPLQAITP